MSKLFFKKIKNALNVVIQINEKRQNKKERKQRFQFIFLFSESEREK